MDGSITETSELPIEELEARITELCGHLNAAQYRWLMLIGEFDRRQGWGDGKLASCAHWLNFKCGLNLGAAREKVRVAHRLDELGINLIDGAGFTEHCAARHGVSRGAHGAAVSASDAGAGALPGGEPGATPRGELLLGGGRQLGAEGAAPGGGGSAGGEGVGGGACAGARARGVR